MTIRPPQSGQSPRTSLARAKPSAAPGTPQRPVDGGASPAPASASAPSRDAVQISPQARALQQTGTSSPGESGALQPERMRQILQRMNDGHYDRPEVQDAVVSRLAEEL